MNVKKFRKYYDDPRVAGVRLPARWPWRESNRPPLSREGGGLGPEKCTNYDFSITTGWDIQASLTLPGDGFLYYDGLVNQYARQDFPAIGGLVELRLGVVSGSPRISIRSFDNSVTYYGGSGTQVQNGELLVRFTHTNSGIRLLCTTAFGAAKFDYLSIRQIL
jgi:hypothetical protein